MDGAAKTGRKSRNNASRKHSGAGKPQKANEPIVIQRHEFLAGRVMYLQSQHSKSPPSYRLFTESVTVGTPAPSPKMSPSAPPGLELPFEIAEAVLPPLDEDEPDPAPVVEVLPPEPEEFKVLLQNMPEAMLKECMLRVMLEQAKLKDTMNLKFANGKALVSFGSYASVVQCINHFSGRQWGSSKVPVVATYVKTIANTGSENVAAKQKAASRPRTLSAEAAVFVPGGSFQLSVDAPVFKPPVEKIGARDRFFSYASTDVGSEGGAEWGDFGKEAVVCTY